MTLCYLLIVQMVIGNPGPRGVAALETLAPGHDPESVDRQSLEECQAVLQITRQQMK